MEAFRQRARERLGQLREELDRGSADPVRIRSRRLEAGDSFQKVRIKEDGRTCSLAVARRPRALGRFFACIQRGKRFMKLIQLFQSIIPSSIHLLPEVR